MFVVVVAYTSIIEQLKITLKTQEAAIHQNKSADQETDAPSADCVKQLSDLIAKKDQELEVRLSLVFIMHMWRCNDT